MAIKLANEGLPFLFGCERAFLSGMNIHLFVNNHTCGCGDSVSSFVECSDSGYLSALPVTLAFGPPYVNGTCFSGCCEVEFDAPAFTWTFTLSGGPFTIYGWYATDPGSGKLVMSENAPQAFTVTAAGQTYTIVPKILGMQLG